MTETQRIELTISAIERRRDRLQRKSRQIQRGPLVMKTQHEIEREKCLAKIEALEWVLAILAEGGTPEPGEKTKQKRG